MTTAELRHLGREQCWPEAVRRAISEVLETADRVRFGRINVGESRMRAAIETAVVAARKMESYLTPTAEETDGQEAAA
jgi:hypothetical protein